MFICPLDTNLKNNIMQRVKNSSNNGVVYPTDGMLFMGNDAGTRPGSASSVNANRSDVTNTTAGTSYYTGDDLVKYVKSSRVYQEAYELMRDYPEWLVRLEAIANSAQDTSAGLFEGFTHKAQNSNQATLSNTFAAISNLVAEFNQWQNSLPSEQVQQQIEAGLNPAMMNQSSSEQSPNAASGSASHAGAVGGDSVGSILGGLASFISSTTNGLFGLVTTVSNTYAQHLKNEMDAIDTVIGIANSGYEMPDFGDFPIFQKYADLIVGTDKYKNITNTQKLELLKSEVSLNFMETLHDKLNPKDLNGPLNQIAGLLVDSMKNQYEFEVADFASKTAEAKYKETYFKTADPTKAAISFNTESDANLAESDYRVTYFKNKKELERRFFDDILSDWLTESQNGSFWHKFMIFSLYQNFGPRDYSGAISDLVGAGTDIVDTVNPISNLIRTIKNAGKGVVKGAGKGKGSGRR